MVASKTQKSVKKSTKSVAKNAKNAKSSMKKSTASKSIHAKKPRTGLSRLARSKEFSRKFYRVSRKTIVTVIVGAMLVVILAVLLAVFNNPERNVKNKIESLAADYYETYLYDHLSEFTTSNKSIEEILSQYENTGLSKVPLRQLLLFDGGRHLSDRAFLTGYCDENETSVRYFPSAPYSRKDYRVEYNYSCIF